MTFRSWLVSSSVVLALAACAEVDPVEPAGDEPAAVGLTGPMPTRPVVGAQQVLVLIARVSDLPPPYPSSDAVLRSQVDTQLASFATFMSAQSYGRAWYQFDVRGPVVLPTTLCGPSADDNQRTLLGAAVAATDATVDYASVRQIILYANVDNTGCLTRTSGQPRKVWPITTVEGPLDASVTFAMDTFETTISTLVHEYAHTLNGGHLEPKVCTVAGLRQPIDHSTSGGQRCVIAPPYGLDHDPLGGSTAVDAPDGLRAFAMPRKLFWGWVPAAEILTPAVTNGYFVRANEAATIAAGDARAIRVPVPGSAAHFAYVLEYRDGTGRDAGQAPGLYLYGDGGSATHPPPLLIAPPPYASTTTFTARPLAVGQRYTDPTYGMSFTLQAAVGSTALVRVDLNESCTPYARRACCYYPGYPCDGAMTCTTAGRWGACWKKCFHTLCL